MSTEYEFTEVQNGQFQDLAGKMKFVGFFSACFGLLALLIALLTTVFINRDRLPAGYREKAVEYYKKAKEKLPDDLKKQADEISLEKIPTDNRFLTGVAVFSGLTGLIFLMQGMWMRSSAARFKRIADTTGKDITSLMHAIGGLQSMYGLMNLLLSLALLAALACIGLIVYHYYFVH